MRALALLFIVLVAGCMGPTAGGDVEPRTVQGYRATPLNTDVASLDDVAGDVVLLSVWASWCTVCKADEPHWQALHDDLSEDGFTLFAVSREISKQHAAEHAATWSFPALWDPDVNHAFGLRDYQPNHVLFDRDGSVVWAYEGSLRHREGGLDAVRADIERLLAPTAMDSST